MISSMLQTPCRAAPMPPPPRPDGDEPDAKRQRTDFVLQPEDEFLERHPGPARVRVQVRFGPRHVPQAVASVKSCTMRMIVHVSLYLFDHVLSMPCRLRTLMTRTRSTGRSWRSRLRRSQTRLLRSKLG